MSLVRLCLGGKALMSPRPVLCLIEHRCSSDLYRRGDTVGGGGQLSELAGKAFPKRQCEPGEEAG